MADETTFDELLGATARWTAAVRAKESAREDRLFYDPWAAALAGKEGANFGRWPYPVIPRTTPDMPRNWYIVARR